MNIQQSNEQSTIWTKECADDYVAQWGDLPLHHQLPEVCKINPTDELLDIGCGSGSAVRAIATVLDTGHVTGIDPTPRMIELANSQTPQSLLSTKATFVLSGAEHLPLPDNSCDVNIAVNTLHHWQDIHKSLGEVNRVLKPAGRFICIDDIWEEMTIHPVAEEMPVTLTDGYNLKSTSDIMTLLTDKQFERVTCEFFREPDLSISVIESRKPK